MRRIALFAIVLVLGVFAFATGQAAEPSTGCNSGAVTPGTTPLGVGIANSGDPTTGAGTLKICNTGAAIPAPAKGALTVTGNPTGQNGSVEVDGDSDNAGAPCTDGFARVGVNSTGAHFWESPDGSFADVNPSQLGNQPAHEVSPDEFVQDTVTNCAGPVPPLPPPPVATK